ncbi:MAG: hypothetical protein EA409_07570 [Saprospirales bacterium]|nr:MAG: hypothetical protein EA409_07570 [Saprospirales bacterium]
MNRYYFTVILLFGYLSFMATTLSCQQEIEIWWVEVDEEDWRDKFPEKAMGEAESLQLIRDWLNERRQEGYLAASADAIHRNDSIWKVYYFLGPRYRWARLNTDGISERWKSSAGLRGEVLQGDAVSSEDLVTVFSSLVTVAENRGYPFASIRLDSIEILGEGIRANLILDRGPLIFFDGVDIQGDANIADYYLASFLDVKPGSPFDMRKVRALKNRLEEIPFIELLSDPTIRFIEDRAIIQLELGRVNASRLDFVLGFLPRDELDRKLIITGNITGEFYNQLGLGERIFIDFERLRPQTQELELAFTYPYLLDMPFGLDTRAEFSRQDSLFLDLSFHLGIEYLFTGTSSVRLFLDNRRSRLLSIDEGSIKTSGMLPDRLDFSRTGLGLAYRLTRLDFALNPTTGWTFQTDVSIGQRTIEKNDRILDLSDEEVDFSQLYDDLSLKTTVINFRLSVNRFFRLANLMTLRLGLKSAHIYNNEEILTNELYRIGGNRLLRGFDEESIFASTYAVSTLEFRLLTGRRSYVFAFWDAAYFENNSIAGQGFSDWPMGFGAGITFDTAAGIFSLSAAVGRQSNNPADFRRAKIHFGYLSLF